jgi:hypothetical protein
VTSDVAPVREEDELPLDPDVPVLDVPDEPSDEPLCEPPNSDEP